MFRPWLGAIIVPVVTGPKVAALFDVDGTLYSAQFGRGLMKHAAVHGRRAAVWSYYLSLVPSYFRYKAGMRSSEFFLRQVIRRLGIFVRNMDAAELDDVFEWNIEQYLFPTLLRPIVSRLKEHRAQGHHVLLVSAQFTPSLKKIAGRLEADGLVGTEIEIIDNRCTGKVLEPVLTGQHKAYSARAYFESRNFPIDWQSSFAYGDSYSDRSILESVGNPVAVFPEDKLRSLAIKKNWTIVEGAA